MSGIRETAMGTPPEKLPLYQKYTPHYAPNEEFDDFPETYSAPSYQKPVEGQIEILLTISNQLIGDIADGYSPEYNFNAAEEKAREIAYDKITDLLKKERLTGYTIAFEAQEGIDDFDVTVILTPTKI